VSSFDIGLKSPGDTEPVDTIMLVEVVIFGSQNRLLHLSGNLI
jgi:hypothetical protein